MYVLCLRHVFLFNVSLPRRRLLVMNEKLLRGRQKKERENSNSFQNRIKWGAKWWRFRFFTVRFSAVNDLSRKVIKTRQLPQIADIKDDLHVFFTIFFAYSQLAVQSCRDVEITIINWSIFSLCDFILYLGESENDTKDGKFLLRWKFIIFLLVNVFFFLHSTIWRSPTWLLF